MKRILVMLGISLLVAGGFLPLHSEARSATSGRAQVLDQELMRDVQRQLKGLGFNPGAVDGNLGAQTVAALRAYQQAYRLPVTGRLDETTLRSILPERFEATGVPLDLSNREVLQQAQRQLKAMGFDPGSTDGTFGPQTEAALRAYQQAYRLPQTGRLDDVTLRSCCRNDLRRRAHGRAAKSRGSAAGAAPAERPGVRPRQHGRHLWAAGGPARLSASLPAATDGWMRRPSLSPPREARRRAALGLLAREGIYGKPASLPYPSRYPASATASDPAYNSSR